MAEPPKEERDTLSADIDALSSEPTRHTSPDHPAPPQEPKATYDASVSIKIKKPMEYLDDMRYKDPQGTINYLFDRKEIYKTAAQRNQQAAKAAVLKLQAVEKELEEEKRKGAEHKKSAAHWKSRAQKELAMKKWWRNVCGVIAVGFIVLIVVVLTVTQMVSVMSPKHQEVPRVPTSGKTPESPNQVLASVNIFNGSKQGSGTVISKGDKYAAVLSAAHNFAGKIGGWVWVYYPDGTYTKATLLAIDRDRDLALLRVDVNTITGHSFVPEKLPDGHLSGCGYTGGQGPNYRVLSYNSTYKNPAGKYMWDLSVVEGPFWDGDSGSGVFINDACVGVTSQRDAKVWLSSNSYYKKLYATGHYEVLNFLKANQSTLAGCGDYTVQPERVYGAEDAPPLWTPKPNVPVPSQTDRILKDLQADVAALKAKSGPPLVRPGDIPDEKKDKKDDGLRRPSEIK